MDANFQAYNERMERIMRNIERHGGRFTPSDPR